MTYKLPKTNKQTKRKTEIIVEIEFLLSSWLEFGTVTLTHHGGPVTDSNNHHCTKTYIPTWTCLFNENTKRTVQE